MTVLEYLKEFAVDNIALIEINVHYSLFIEALQGGCSWDGDLDEADNVLVEFIKDKEEVIDVLGDVTLQSDLSNIGWDIEDKYDLAHGEAFEDYEDYPSINQICNIFGDLTKSYLYVTEYEKDGKRLRKEEIKIKDLLKAKMSSRLGLRPFRDYIVDYVDSAAVTPNLPTFGHNTIDVVYRFNVHKLLTDDEVKVAKAIDNEEILRFNTYNDLLAYVEEVDLDFPYKGQEIEKKVLKEYLGDQMVGLVGGEYLLITLPDLASELRKHFAYPRRRY